MSMFKIIVDRKGQKVIFIKFALKMIQYFNICQLLQYSRSFWFKVYYMWWFGCFFVVFV